VYIKYRAGQYSDFLLSLLIASLLLFCNLNTVHAPLKMHIGSNVTEKIPIMIVEMIKDPDERIKWCNRLLRVPGATSQDKSDALTFRGEIFSSDKENFSQAIAYFTLVLSFTNTEDQFFIYGLRADSNTNLKAYDLAIQGLTKAIQLADKANPNNVSRLYGKRGTAYNNLGEYDLSWIFRSYSSVFDICCEILQCSMLFQSDAEQIYRRSYRLLGSHSTRPHEGSIWR
jgi:hypothetical protein